MDDKEQLQKNEPQNNEETLTREPEENFDNDKGENNEDIINPTLSFEKLDNPDYEKEFELLDYKALLQLKK